MNRERGDADTFLMFAIVLIVVGVIFAAIFVRFQTSDDVVSGIVYNTKNNQLISGSTTFSVRASTDTYVTEANESSYCLPSNSPFKALVNRAAADKNIKVIVTARKYFAIQAPWVCNPNVSIEEAK